MTLSVLDDLGAVSAGHWNRIAGENPFLRHEFLLALERTGCVGARTGWSPRHLVLHSDGPKHGELIGAVPLYLKSHSYGEYVFDWSWADAYARSGRSYYPKLVATVPFTPATGERLLVAPDADRENAAVRLINGARELAEASAASSLHWLFSTDTELDLLASHGFLPRVGCQLHWSNPGYRDFEDFLGTLTAHKRNNIRRERRRVREAGVTLAVLRGAAITPEIWNIFYDFYRATVRQHDAIPYLTREFFAMLGETMTENVVMVVAQYGNECVGAAFCLRNAHTLYGRYWGGQPGFPDLHFETCYYTAIEYCIAEGLARYEAGAQGEHKLARGFVPAPTYSAHWLRDAAFGRAVADFLQRERGSVEHYMNELNERSPFRRLEFSMLYPRE